MTYVLRLPVLPHSVSLSVSSDDSHLFAFTQISHLVSVFWQLYFFRAWPLILCRRATPLKQLILLPQACNRSWVNERLMNQRKRWIRRRFQWMTCNLRLCRYLYPDSAKHMYITLLSKPQTAVGIACYMLTEICSPGPRRGH